MSRFCSKCGKAADLDSAYCPKCGTPLAQTVSAQTKTPEAVTPPTQPPGKAKGCLLVILAVVILSAIAHSCGSSTPPPETSLAPTEGYAHKAVADVNVASKIGNLTSEAKTQYRAGLEHIRNSNQKLGNYTIGEVVHLGFVPPTSEPAPQDFCSDANNLENTAVKAYNASNHKRSYDLAVQGISVNEKCEDDSRRLVNEGYLMSIKGLSEHYLPEGDSRTDLNQANALLVECQTKPGLYGTHTGAECETQEHNNISSQTDWDVNQ